LGAVFCLAACGADTTGDETGSGEPSQALALSMDLPDSVTGGPQTIDNSQASLRAARSGTGTACAFLGARETDPFRNGYAMTQFLVSAVATWTCFADTLIELADDVPHDGTIYATDNQVGQPGYDRDDPTHYAVVDDSDTQTTMKFYYGYDGDTPPLAADDPQFYLSWITAADNSLTGRLIIDALGLDPEDRDPEEPIMLRMDFGYDEAVEEIDMFLRFDANNPWAEGFRIQLTKDLTVGPLDQVFTALGLIEMRDQFLPAAGIDEVPEVHIFTVSDSFGNGAALADFRQLSLPLELNADTGNHLGNYLFDKTDRYFFDEDMDWDWIAKSIPAATYRGSRTTPESGGSWIPFDPSLDLITTELELDADYFFGDKCAQVDDDCTALLNAVFADGFADQEPNQGADPEDWRSAAIATPGSLTTIYPNGTDWSGAFDMALTPNAEP
jgi:hypothetical protein